MSSFMYIKCAKQHLRYSICLRIVAAFSGIHLPYLFHLAFGKLKIKDVQITGNPARIRGFGKDNDPFLYLKS